MRYQLTHAEHHKPTREQILPCRGVSFYRGVIIMWDEDHDPRVQQVVDQLLPTQKDNLVAIQEHEASLSLVVKDPTRAPSEYDEFEVDFGGDIFNVYEVIPVYGYWAHS